MEKWKTPCPVETSRPRLTPWRPALRRTARPVPHVTVSRCGRRVQYPQQADGGASESLRTSSCYICKYSVCFTVCLFYTITVNTRPSIVSIYAATSVGMMTMPRASAVILGDRPLFLELVPAVLCRQVVWSRGNVLHSWCYVHTAALTFNNQHLGDKVERWLCVAVVAQSCCLSKMCDDSLLNQTTRWNYCDVK